MKKIIIPIVAVVGVLLLAFLTVFILAKTKVIFINEWFVDKNNSTIGVDISSYQADVDMEKLKEQDIHFVYIAPIRMISSPSTGRTRKRRGCHPARITSSPSTRPETHRLRTISKP